MVRHSLCGGRGPWFHLVLCPCPPVGCCVRRSPSCSCSSGRRRRAVAEMVGSSWPGQREAAVVFVWAAVGQHSALEFQQRGAGRLGFDHLWAGCTGCLGLLLDSWSILISCSPTTISRSCSSSCSSRSHRWEPWHRIHHLRQSLSAPAALSSLNPSRDWYEGWLPSLPTEDHPLTYQNEWADGDAFALLALY